MNSQLIIKQIPDQWMYRVDQVQFNQRVEFVKESMKRFLVRQKTTGNWDERFSKRYHTDKVKANCMFTNFCTIVAQASLFKELHQYLFPYSRGSQLWSNSVLSKLAGKSDREMFFLMAKNRDLLEESRKLF